MALYGTTSLYGGVLYGNPNYITTLGTQYQSFIDAQNADVRRVSGQLIINTHMVQMGRNVLGNTELIGGSGTERKAQSFIAPYSMSLAGVSMMLRAGATGNTDDINVSLIVGTSPYGTLVGSTNITAPQNLALQWKKATFNSPITLSSGSTYWIVAKNALNSTNSYYTGYDSLQIGDWNSAAFGSGTWTIGTDRQYFARTISAVEVENDKQVAELTSFKLVRDAESPSNQLTCEIINANQKYSEGEAYSDYMTAGNECRAYIGFNIGSNTAQYYQVFKGITENSPVGVSNGQILAKDYMGKMLGDYTSSGTLGGVAYETAIQTMATRSGIASFGLRTTGLTTANPLSFQNNTTSDICEKIREATSDVMQFRNDGTLRTEVNAKLNTYNWTTPKYYIQHDENMLDCEVEKVTDKLINRITVTNDENGETAIDFNTLKVGDYITIGTGTYSMGSTTGTQNGTLSFTHASALGYPTIYMDWSTAGTQIKLTEVSRSCGNSTTVGNITFTLTNKAYGVSAGTTTLTVLGCPISNAGTATVLSETLAQSSYESYGKFSTRYDNKVLASVENANGLGTTILSQYSEPIRNMKMNTKGIVDLYPNDVIQVVEPTRLKLSNLGVTRLVELNWQNDPSMFTNYIEAWKLDMGFGAYFMLQENGDYILQENGDKIYL